MPFPQALPEFQRLFPDDAACAAYLERGRWSDGFVCPYCGVVAEPFRIATRPGILAYRVFFDWDQSGIDAEGAEVVRQATTAALQGELKRVGAPGHTDSSGGERL